MSRNHDHAAHMERMAEISRLIGAFAALPPAERKRWLAELRRRYGERRSRRGSKP